MLSVTSTYCCLQAEFAKSDRHFILKAKLISEVTPVKTPSFPGLNNDPTSCHDKTPCRRRPWRGMTTPIDLPFNGPLGWWFGYRNIQPKAPSTTP